MHHRARSIAWAAVGLMPLLGLGLGSLACSSTPAPAAPDDSAEGGSGAGGQGGKGGRGMGGKGGAQAGSGGIGAGGKSGGQGGDPGGGQGGTAAGGSGAGGQDTSPDAGADVAPPGADGPPVVVEPTDLAKFSSFKVLTMNTSATGANVMGNVDNFPVAVVLSATSFDFALAKEHGEDLRFSKMDGTLLPYAIESWDKAGKTATIWVSVDHVLGNNATQAIRMHWGNATAADASDTKAVFDTKFGFVGVWHLDEDGNNDPDGYKDASANEAHATGVMMAPGSRVDARVGKGTWLQNSAAAPKDQWIKVDTAKRASFNPNGKPLTVSLWALAKSFPNRSTIGGYETVISKGDTSWTLQRTGTTKNWETCVRTPAYHACAISKTPNATNTWFFFTIVFAQPNITLYINGARDAMDVDDGWEMGDQPLGLGQQTQSLNGKRNWDGILDEARIANVSRDANWIKLDYESQKEGQKFLTFGPAQQRM
jgi:hypothetical protein